MNKVIKFELKKIVSRPGIYVLAILLAILLTVTAFLYNPKQNNKTYNVLDGNSIEEISADFENNYKYNYDTTISNTLSLSNYIKENSGQAMKSKVKSYYDDFVSTSNTFCDMAVNNTASNDELDANFKLIYNAGEENGSFENLYSFVIKSLGNSSNKYFLVATTTENYKKLDSTFADVKNNFDTLVQSKDFKALANKLKINYLPKITEVLNLLVYPDYSPFINDFVNDGKYYNITNERIRIVSNEMSNYKNQASINESFNTSKTNINKYNDLYNYYRLSAENYSKLLNSSLKATLLESFSTNDMNNIKFVSDVNLYGEQEQIARLKYYITHDKTEYDFASSLSFDYTSNNKVNAYDYSYYALSIFNVILISFCILLASHAIAGETKEGTMRFVAIRPVSREKLLLGKFFSIAIISFIMLLFSASATLVVGGFMFGFNSLNIMTIVDASTVILIHPAVSLLIFLLSTYVQLLIYTSIAILLSSFLKSDLMALVLSIVLYFINLLLPLFFGANSWLRFYPFLNINFYAYVGAGTIAPDSILGKLFSSVVYSGMNIWFSAIIAVSMLIIFNLIAVTLFKKREL